MNSEIDRSVEADMDAIINAAFPKAKWGFVMSGPGMVDIAPNANELGVQFISYWFFIPIKSPKDVPHPVSSQPRIIAAYAPAHDPQCMIESYDVEGEPPFNFHASVEQVQELAAFAREMRADYSKLVSR